ncbi:MAG: hypothetical protein ACR2NP_19295 [Pirellulaceae bacterium]
MSLFQRLFGKRGFHRFADSFTRTREAKFANLQRWVQTQSEQGRHVLVLAHFESTFLEAQAAIQQSGFDFEILARPQSQQQLVRTLYGSPAGITITMSQMLAPSEEPEYREAVDLHIAMMITERYPLVERDVRLEDFARSLAARVNMGYLMSFEDPVIRRLLGDRFIFLMEQLGLGENDLVQSAMTERALQQRIRRATQSVVDEQEAGSPEQWLEVNMPVSK